MDATFDAFFHPRGVVVVGASSDPVKLGHGTARNLVRSGYRGAIHFVNPKGGELFGRPIYPHLRLVPDPADLAVIVIPAPGVPATLRACGERGIRAAIVASGGFRETGVEGAGLEAECIRAAREFGMRLIGPNCIGLLDTHEPLDTTFLPPSDPAPGDVAFLSHSGAICEAVIDWAGGQGFGLSRLVSLGNQADLTETDLLAPVAADPHTRVLTLYLEGIADGRRFVQQAACVTRRTPIIALKVGRFSSGARAVASHTGALAGHEAAYNAAFRRAGVIRAETSEEMFDWARALAWCPLPQGRAMAVLTSAGGPGAIAADALEAAGLQLAELSDATRAALRGRLPAAASVRNPVDMLASASPSQYADCLRVLLDDPAVNGVFVIALPPPTYTSEAIADALVPIVRPSSKPVVLALMGENLIRRASEIYRAAHVPDYRFPERAASSLAMLAERAEMLARPPSSPVTFDDVRPEAVRHLLESKALEDAPSPDGAAGSMRFLGQARATRLLAAYGIPVPRIELANTPDEAVDLAAEMGYPVALKIASPDITHKSDVGGVLLNLRDAAAVSEGFHAIRRQARSAVPGAIVLGAHVQRMLPAGQEVIVGVVKDPQFGPLIMFGSGGVEVEGLRDVAFALTPLSLEDAEHMLEGTWAGRKLRGYRSLAPADRKAVLNVILRLAQLAADFPELEEIEINPLRVMPAGQGAVAVDVRVRVGESEAR